MTGLVLCYLQYCKIVWKLINRFVISVLQEIDSVLLLRCALLVSTKIAFLWSDFCLAWPDIENRSSVNVIYWSAIKAWIACGQVNELKKQVEQISQQGDGMMLEDVIGDHGDVTFRLGFTASAGPDNKQREKIRQIERQRKEANDVSCFASCCSFLFYISTNSYTDSWWL